MMYAYSHREEQDWNHFFGGWAATVAVGFGTGFVTGAFGAWLGPAGMASQISGEAFRYATAISKTAREFGLLKNTIQSLMGLTPRALLGTGLGVVGQVGKNGIDGKDLTDDLWQSALFSLGVSSVTGFLPSTPSVRVWVLPMGTTRLVTALALAP
jgi:hypothetical protein